jgi:hypothetical protein
MGLPDTGIFVYPGSLLPDPTGTSYVKRGVAKVNILTLG